jgi:checkpoint serine/threonine-protein kinase
MPLAGRHTILDAVNACFGPDRAMDELLAMFLSSKLLKALLTLQRQCRIVHGDVKPDNILLRFSNFNTSNSVLDGTGIVLIDFGKSIDFDLIDDEHALFRNDWLAGDQSKQKRRSRDWFDERIREPFNWSVDWAGSLAVIYCLLFGEYLNCSAASGNSSTNSGTAVNVDKWKWKRYWQSDMWRRWVGKLASLSDTNSRSCWQTSLAEVEEIVSEMTLYLDQNGESHGKSLSSLIRQLEIRLS